MSVADIKAALVPHLPDLSALEATMKIDFGDDRLFIDGTKSPALLSHDDSEADCTLLITSDNMTSILDGTLDPTMAFMTGKLKVRGATGVALKLANIVKASA
jgi:putative sterol carrier protein